MDKKNGGNGKDALSKKPYAPNSAVFVDIKSSIQPKMSCVANSDVDHGTMGPEPGSMSVPDPDFHDFDQYRTEKSFGENQVWAAYDDDDGMPRYFATILSVISSKPLKMRMSWLNSKSNAELAPLNWIGSGFYKTSGEVWIGKYGVNRNWSSGWNTLTPDEVIHKYDTVKVLEDYNDQNDVAVAPLVKVQGFKTLFCKHSRPNKPWVIPREELFCFSHQVPSYLQTGQEGYKSCKGCFELDPAATPLQLLQVLTKAQVKEIECMIETAWEDASHVD
ncbi:hypothetical protein V6N13_036025 [Hibiscus sabdariffa]